MGRVDRFVACAGEPKRREPCTLRRMRTVHLLIGEKGRELAPVWCPGQLVLRSPVTLSGRCFEPPPPFRVVGVNLRAKPYCAHDAKLPARYWTMGLYSWLPLLPLAILELRQARS